MNKDVFGLAFSYRKQSLLELALEIAQGLYEAGIIKKKELKEFESLCKESVVIQLSKLSKKPIKRKTTKKKSKKTVDKYNKDN